MINFVNNSLLHAFKPDDAGEMLLQALQGDDSLVIRFTDNGCGIHMSHAKVDLFDVVLSFLESSWLLAFSLWLQAPSTQLQTVPIDKSYQFWFKQFSFLSLLFQLIPKHF